MTLLARYAPAVILIDEWVAYARSLMRAEDLAGGTFDDQFTFAQSLTEAAKGTSGRAAGDLDPRVGERRRRAGRGRQRRGGRRRARSGGTQAAAERGAPGRRPVAAGVVGRGVPHRPAAAVHDAGREGAGRDRRDGARRSWSSTASTPTTSRARRATAAYEDRIKRTYPIHPELFDRLYEDWSTLERFQRTRGVLRLMSTVIHALWVGEDAVAADHARVDPDRDVGE